MPFVKMHGLGNDYVYLDERQTRVGDGPRWSRRVSDRHEGIGGDGLIVLRRDAEFPCRMEMYNADGSRAEMCGNGLRCVARLAWERGYTDGTKFTVATDSGPRPVEVLPATAGTDLAVRVAMGPPQIEELEAELEVTAGRFTGSILSVGNPHFVVELDGSPADFPVEEVGPLLEVHPRFPNRANIEFVFVRDRRSIDFRVWERGSGETRACGTGATAAAAALHRRGRLDPRVTVHLLGGDLEIEMADDGELFMTGPATKVFEGTFSRAWADG